MNLEGFKTFLEHNAAFFSKPPPNKPKVNIVMGNESGDLDSILSSLLYAYFKQHTNPQDIYLPILNIPQEEVSLRKELFYFLDSANLDAKSLLCIDQFYTYFSSEHLESQNTELTLQHLILVDHNRLISSQRYLSDYVIEVVDHHVDETEYLPNLQHKTIEIVGSACTLISEIILSKSEQMIDAALSKFLLGTILIDTILFDENAKKTTEKDRSISHSLVEIIMKAEGVNDVSPIQEFEYEKSLFDAINIAKSSIEGFSTDELLRKDFKAFDIPNPAIPSFLLGMASVKTSSTVMLTKTDNPVRDPIPDFKLFCEKKKLQVLIVGTEFFGEEGNYHRELITYIHVSDDNHNLRNALTEFYVSQFSGIEKERNDVYSVYEINAQNSRKIISPQIVSFLTSFSF